MKRNLRTHAMYVSTSTGEIQRTVGSDDDPVDTVNHPINSEFYNMTLLNVTRRITQFN